MPHDFMPGLAGVPAAKSSISDVDGQRGVLEYRGIRIEELCLRSSYLETAYLLLFGHLPTEPQFARWNEDLLLVYRHCFRISLRGARRFACLSEEIIQAAAKSRGAARGRTPRAVRDGRERRDRREKVG